MATAQCSGQWPPCEGGKMTSHREICVFSTLIIQRAPRDLAVQNLNYADKMSTPFSTLKLLCAGTMNHSMDASTKKNGKIPQKSSTMCTKKN